MRHASAADRDGDAMQGSGHRDERGSGAGSGSGSGAKSRLQRGVDNGDMTGGHLEGGADPTNVVTQLDGVESSRVVGYCATFRK